MENKTNPETSITKKQFARIHEKIQNKYEEMQRKLEKSKSIDILDDLNHDFDYKSERKYASVSDLQEDNEIDNVLSNNVFSNAKSSPSVNKSSAVFEAIIVKNAVIKESESLLSLTETIDSEQEDSIENSFFGNNAFKTSIESLPEAAKESDDSIDPPTSTPKSIRHRIGSRIAAARNRRREEKVKREKLKKDKVEKFIFSNSTKYDFSRFEKKIRLATVTVALIEITGFEEDPEEKSRTTLCRFRLGTEKQKSKLVKGANKTVKFQELFNFNHYEDEDILEVAVWDKDILIGRCTIDVSELEKEKTHTLKKMLEGETPNIQVFMLVTVSGISLTNTLYDLDESKYVELVQSSKRKYRWFRLCDKFSNVGRLWIIVYGAKGLSGNDCYCVLNLNNESVRTATDYKTNSPNWMKIFSFNVTDITSSLEAVIYDEKKSEEVGKITIPLLNIEPGKKWYALKDLTQRQIARGQNPRILLEINVNWNFIKAAIRVINIKETKYLETDDKLDRHVFARNLSRAKAVISWTLNFLKIFKTCFQWESMKINITALVVWITFWSFGKIWMSPLLLLIPFVVYNPKRSTLKNWRERIIKNESSESENESKLDKDEKSISLRQRINSWQEMILVVQNSIGKFASLGESVKNLYNFSVPFVSCLAIFFIVLIAFVMYLIPFNYICITWGIHKFTQKILRPNRIPHNEIMDLISRVPDDEALEQQRELPVLSSLDDDE